MYILKEILLELEDRILEGEISCIEDLDDVIYNVTMHPSSYDIAESEIKQCLFESDKVGHILESWSKSL